MSRLESILAQIISLGSLNPNSKELSLLGQKVLKNGNWKELSKTKKDLYIDIMKENNAI